MKIKPILKNKQNKKTIYTRKSKVKKIVNKNIKKHVRMQDNIIIIAGKYKKTTGKVNNIYGEYVNVDSVYEKKFRKSPKTNKKEMQNCYPKIHISNIMHYDRENNIRSRRYVKFIDEKKTYFYKNQVAIPANYINKNKEKKENE